MGFLDIFDSPDIMSALIGSGSLANNPMGGMSGGSPQPPPQPPQPPPQMQANADPSVAGGGGPGQTFDQRFGPPQQNLQTLTGATAPGMPQGPDNFNARFPGGTSGLPTFADNTSIPVRAGDQYAGVPPGPAPGAPPGAPPPNLPASGPAPMPPADVMRQSPGTSSGGDLASVFGLNPNSVRAALAGIGKGMTAVGQQKPGTFGGTSFAAGVGGGLEGAVHQGDIQEQQKRAAQNDAFNQKSTAFKDWVEAEKLGDSKLINASRAKMYEAHAAMYAMGGKAAQGESAAWQNNPYGRAMNIEKLVQTEQRNRELALERRLKLLQATPEQSQEAMDKLDKSMEQFRKEKYEQFKIDPNESKRGSSDKFPFEWDKLTPAQKRAMPDGAWYRTKQPGAADADKDGYVYRHRDYFKQPPYEGWSPPGDQQPQQQQRPMPSPGAVEANDQAVMAGAA